MKYSSEQAGIIKSYFKDMTSKDDLLMLLNYAKQIIYRDKAQPIEMRSLNYYSRSDAEFTKNGTPTVKKKRYDSFEIIKKDGTYRKINAPVQGLKVIQECLNLILQVLYSPNDVATGFVIGKSVVDNARFHIGQNYVYNIDLKDFFSSIDQSRWWGRLQHPPFNLNTNERRLRLASIIAGLTCYEMEVEREVEPDQWQIVKRTVLPQGAPTSPIITNIICERLDRRLSGTANRFGLRYSRYADDITFSSMHNVYAHDGDFLKEVNRIILDQNFCIKTKKTRLQKTGYKQEVTGLIVNEKVNVEKRYIGQIRTWLYLWERYGYTKANNLLNKDFIRNGKLRGKEYTLIDNVISGKLQYLKMVKGEGSTTYQKYYRRFSNLSAHKIYKPIPALESNMVMDEAPEYKIIRSVKVQENFVKEAELMKIVHLLVNEGLASAMTEYNKKRKAYGRNED